MKPSKPPVVGEFYRLPHGRRKAVVGNQRYGDIVESGIYIVTYVDLNIVKLRLISKIEFHGSGRRWLKKSKFMDELTHAEFAAEYEDDAVSFLQEEFDAVKASYAMVLGTSI